MWGGIPPVFYPSMSKSVLAAVMPAPLVPVEIREFPEPDLPRSSALLRTSLSEVCGTDVHLWHARLSGVPYPIIPGHVTTGTLDQVRGPLTDVEGGALREDGRWQRPLLVGEPLVERVDRHREGRAFTRTKQDATDH